MNAVITVRSLTMIFAGPFTWSYRGGKVEAGRILGRRGQIFVSAPITMSAVSESVFRARGSESFVFGSFVGARFRKFHRKW
jgi:hypothetical protein